MEESEFKALLLQSIHNKENPYHPLVWINGDPVIGKDTYIGGFSEINAKGAKITIGDYCDIASFVAINVADSHRKCIGLTNTVNRLDIIIGSHVFIGSHCTILGGVEIGHHSVVAAGSVLRSCCVPPFSLVIGDNIKKGYYLREYEAIHGVWHGID